MYRFCQFGENLTFQDIVLTMYLDAGMNWTGRLHAATLVTTWDRDTKSSGGQHCVKFEQF